MPPKAANLVLLDSNFASMPHIVNEGRRVINNIRMAASMFLIKTIFSMLLIMTVFLGENYPFIPIQAFDYQCLRRRRTVPNFAVGT